MRGRGRGLLLERRVVWMPEVVEIDEISCVGNFGGAVIVAIDCCCLLKCRTCQTLLRWDW